MSQLDAMTDTEIVALIKTFEPHDEGGQPMVSMHWDLWKRVLALGAIPMLNGDWSKVEPMSATSDMYDEKCRELDALEQRMVALVEKWRDPYPGQSPAHLARNQCADELNAKIVPFPPERCEHFSLTAHLVALEDGDSYKCAGPIS